MAVLNKGSFSLNLGLVRLTGDLSDEDRQRAWELYTEISTRVALTGKYADSGCTDFRGEVYAESLSSVYAFFQEARGIMKAFPVGQLGEDEQNHLGVLINNLMKDVLRPFLEKWQADYRYWWKNLSNPRLPTLERQQEYPRLDDLFKDWSDVRKIMRELQSTLVEEYKLVNLSR